MYYVIKQADLNEKKVIIQEGVGTFEEPFEAYFHPVDIALVRDQVDPTQNVSQPDRPKVVGYQVFHAIFKGESPEPDKPTYILVAISDFDLPNGKGAPLLADGDIVALSCPPFTDDFGGRKHTVDKPIVPLAPKP
ncbi:MAG: hypothetical protein AAFR61_14100 [Bacteroidota bacterium]